MQSAGRAALLPPTHPQACCEVLPCAGLPTSAETPRSVPRPAQAPNTLMPATINPVLLGGLVLAGAARFTCGAKERHLIMLRFDTRFV